MKRGKKFLLYISSIAFCCLMMLFFSSVEVDASSTFTCIDKETGNVCDSGSEEFYYRLDKIVVDSSVTKLELPSTYDNIKVEEIASDVIDSSEALNLDSLVLPQYLEKINDNAFSSIASLKEVIIPTSVSYIGASVFKDDAHINNIYLNHASFDDLDKNMYIDVNAFTNISIDRIISDTYDIYNYYANSDNSPLKDLPVVTIVNYNYYAYQNEELTDLNSKREYYIGKNQTIDFIPDDLALEGLTFLGWYLKTGDTYTKIELGKNTFYQGNMKEYHVYPKFELNELSFDISSVDSNNKETTSARYNGRENLIKLSVINLEHDLIDEVSGETTLKYESLVWNKIVAGTSSLVSNNEYIYLDSVIDTGVYECVVTYSYKYNGYVYYVSDKDTITISITRAPLYVIVSGVTKTYGTYLTESDVEYTVKGLLWQDSINKIVKTFPHKGDIQARSYQDAIQVEIDSITDGSEEKINNYDILYSYGEYIVKPKVIEIYYDKNIEFTYGDNIVISDLYVDKQAYGMFDTIVTIYFVKTPGLGVGSYTVEGIKSIDSSNFVVDFNKEKSTGIIKINPYKVESHVEVDDSVYNGKSKELSVYYRDVNGVRIDLDYSLAYKGNSIEEVINAGSYLVNIESIDDDNYAFVDTSETIKIINIEKATPTVKYSAYQRFSYNGDRINPNITIDNSEQTPVFTCTLGNMMGNYCKNAGTYSVSVWYDESENYKEANIASITLTIEKLQISLTPKDFAFYYGEKIEAKEEITINGETVIAEYISNDAVGNELKKYPIVSVILRDSITGANHNNYVGSILLNECLEKIEILARPITIVYYNYDNLVYDGKVKAIGAYAIDNISQKVVDGLNFNVVSDEGVIKDAKTYHLRAYFDSPYYKAVNTNLLVVNIDKANYDVSNIKFEDKTFIFNFKKHAIYVEGDLPEGVSVEYSIDGEEGNSVSFALSKKVVAKFIIDELNYMPIESMEATIHLDMSWFILTLAIFIALIGAVICASILYVIYRRVHPKKIKLKIKTVVKEDLEAKRAATSVKEVLGDKEKEEEIIEDENDLIVDSTKEAGFIERIYAASSELKQYYSEVKNELLSYEGIKHTIDRRYEVFYHGTRQIAKLSICNNILRLYVNLDPSKYDKATYNHLDMSDFDCHARTPLRINVSTTESLRHAKVFIRILRKKENLKAVSNFVKIDYEKFYTLKENIFPRLFKKMFSSDDKKQNK